MATHSSVLAWRSPQTEKPAVHGAAQSQTRLKRLSSSTGITHFEKCVYAEIKLWT